MISYFKSRSKVTYFIHRNSLLCGRLLFECLMLFVTIRSAMYALVDKQHSAYQMSSVRFFVLVKRVLFYSSSGERADFAVKCTFRCGKTPYKLNRMAKSCSFNLRTVCDVNFILGLYPLGDKNLLKLTCRNVDFVYVC